ncbi:MAG: cation:dicarboxylate symporter family transporter, partial [Burkholderiaceae bacterium]
MTAGVSTGTAPEPRRPRFPLSTQILIGLALGVFAGVFFGEPIAVLQPLADVYIRLMQMTVLPYLVLTLIVGLGQLDGAEARRLAMRGGLLFLLFVMLAIVVIGVMPLAFPHVENASFFSHALVEPRQPLALTEIYVPANPFNALANSIVPGVVLFSAALGIALIGVDGKLTLLANLRILERAVVRVTHFVISLTPLGVFAIAAVAAGTMEPATFVRLEVYLLTLGVAAMLLSFVVFPLLVTAVTPFRYREVLAAAGEAMLTAFIANSVFIVLPMLVERANALMNKHGLGSARADSSVNVIIPLAFTFPNAGRLLTLLFVPYVAWLAGDPLGEGSYGTLFGAGVLAYFAKAQVALPFLMDLLGVPHDYFQLYIPASIVTGKFDSMTSAMSLFALALVSAAAVTGFLRWNVRRLIGHGLLALAIIVIALVATRAVLASSIDTLYRKDRLLTGMHLTRSPVAVIVRNSVSAEARDPALGLERIRQRGTLRVGFSLDQVPFA